MPAEGLGVLRHWSWLWWKRKRTGSCSKHCCSSLKHTVGWSTVKLSKKKINKTCASKTTLYLEKHVAVEEQCCIITGVASHGKVLMEKIWGFECCWHFPKGLSPPPPTPERTYLLMLVVMMGCQQKDKVLRVNHGPLQWSRSTDGWPWWTLGCNRETKTDHEKKPLDFVKYQKSKIHFQRNASVASRMCVCW